MIRKSTRTVSQGNGSASLRRPSGGLTCSEWQVDDVLSAGESTEEQCIYPAKQIESGPMASSLGDSQMTKSSG